MSAALQPVTSGHRRQVIVMVGEPEPNLLILLIGLRKLGFSAVAKDDHVVVWSRLLSSAAPDLFPSRQPSQRAKPDCS